MCCAVDFHATRVFSAGFLPQPGLFKRVTCLALMVSVGAPRVWSPTTIQVF